MPHLFRNESCDPKTDAQRNLAGRTHYVDDDTLRFHRSRILATHTCDDGLLFALVESCAANWENTKRGFRGVIFDVFGTVLSKTKLEEMHSTRKAAEKALWAELNNIDARAHTFKAIESAERYFRIEMDELRGKLNSQEAA